MVRSYEQVVGQAIVVAQWFKRIELAFGLEASLTLSRIAAI